MNFSKQTIGWIQGIITVFIFLGINQIVSRYSSVVLEVNPVVFSCCAFASCALILIAIGGHGPLVKETIRSVDTWLYGFVLMLSYIIGLILYAYVTSTELTMLQKISVSLTLFCSWLFLARKPDLYQLIGASIVTIGVIIVAYDVKSEYKGYVFFMSFLYGFVQAARVFLAELHRVHSKAADMSNDPKAKMRVIGFIMLIVSVIFISGSLLVALVQQIDGQAILKGLPTLDSFQHKPTIIAGLLSGILLMAPLRVLEFSSAKIIKAENFMVLLTFMTVSTLFWEWATQGLTGMDIKSISGLDLVAVLFITLGGLTISLTRKLKKKDKNDEFKEYLKYSAQDVEAVEETREIIANALEHFNSNLKQTAKALNIPVKVLTAILEDKEKILAFKPDTLSQVAKSYRKNVATADSLTGLLNKGGFMTALKAASFESDQLSLFFIDLNKFKPVNDTYGHEVGDFVLQIVATRLQELFPNKSLITRLGGDEYCILLLDTTKEQAEEKIEIISQALEQEIIYNNHKIIISGSIGLAHYPTDTKNAEELITLADKQMYVKKEGR
jgi:diguanylate cyclase (GGDEF)-like protein